MGNKSEMIETDQSLDVLIQNSIDLIQYARQLDRKIWKRLLESKFGIF